MCKMMATNLYQLQEHEDLCKQNTLIILNIADVDDKRIHATMYPVNAINVYKACIAGIRRQKY